MLIHSNLCDQQINWNQQALFGKTSDRGLTPGSNGPVCEKLWTDWAEDPDYAGDYRRVGSICKRADEIPNYKGDAAKEVENTDLLAKKYLGCEAYNEDHSGRYLSYGYYYGSENNRQTGLTKSLVWLRFADVLLMHSELTDGKAVYKCFLG